MEFGNKILHPEPKPSTGGSVIVNGIETHPSLHNVSKIHEVKAQVPQVVYDMMTEALQSPELPFKSQAEVIREALFSYCSDVLDGYLSKHMRMIVQREKLTARYKRLKDEREDMQNFLRLARDELINLLGKGEKGKEQARKQVVSTLDDMEKWGDDEQLNCFMCLPVVQYIVQENGPDFDLRYHSWLPQELIEYDLDLFRSERGIP